MEKEGREGEGGRGGRAREGREEREEREGREREGGDIPSSRSKIGDCVCFVCVDGDRRGEGDLNPSASGGARARRRWH